MSELEVPGKEANVLKGHEGAVLAARFNSDGNYCLSCGKDRTIRLWNPHRGIHIKTYKSHAREVRDVHVTPYSLSLSKPIVNSIPNYYFFTLIFFLGIIRSCVHVVEIDKSFTGMYQQVVLFVNFVAMMARFVFFFF